MLLSFFFFFIGKGEKKSKIILAYVSALSTNLRICKLDVLEKIIYVVKTQKYNF